MEQINSAECAQKCDERPKHAWGKKMRNFRNWRRIGEKMETFGVVQAAPQGGPPVGTEPELGWKMVLKKTTMQKKTMAMQKKMPKNPQILQKFNFGSKYFQLGSPFSTHFSQKLSHFGPWRQKENVPRWPGRIWTGFEICGIPINAFLQNPHNPYPSFNHGNIETNTN